MLWNFRLKLDQRRLDIFVDFRLLPTPGFRVAQWPAIASRKVDFLGLYLLMNLRTKDTPVMTFLPFSTFPRLSVNAHFSHI